MGKQVAIFQNVFLFFVAAHVAEILPAALPTVQTFSEAVGCGRPDRGRFGTDGTIGWRAALRPAPTAGVLGVDCLDDICNDFSRASAIATVVALVWYLASSSAPSPLRGVCYVQRMSDIVYSLKTE